MNENTFFNVQIYLFLHGERVVNWTTLNPNTSLRESDLKNYTNFKFFGKNHTISK